MSFKQKFNAALQHASDEFQRLNNAGKLKTEEDVDGLAANKEISELVSLIESEFIWIAGKYTVTFDFKSPSKFVYTKDTYAFNLSQEDVNELKRNIDNLKLDITQRAKTIAIKDFEPKEIIWVWRIPELTKI
ncbi:MAG: hypothetical protein A2Z25_12165 [Planctomycetes bacterium RBG_16_55_9]|nr:MAG: hypothetical protein A2Z25_12165 [Planctomycetes bacterium RBG_16_55_9]